MAIRADHAMSQPPPDSPVWPAQQASPYPLSWRAFYDGDGTDADADAAALLQPALAVDAFRFLTKKLQYFEEQMRLPYALSDELRGFLFDNSPTAASAAADWLARPLTRAPDPERDLVPAREFAAFWVNRAALAACGVAVPPLAEPVTSARSNNMLLLTDRARRLVFRTCRQTAPADLRGLSRDAAAHIVLSLDRTGFGIMVKEIDAMQLRIYMMTPTIQERWPALRRCREMTQDDTVNVAEFQATELSRAILSVFGVRLWGGAFPAVLHGAHASDARRAMNAARARCDLSRHGKGKRRDEEPSLASLQHNPAGQKTDEATYEQVADAAHPLLMQKLDVERFQRIAGKVRRHTSRPGATFRLTQRLCESAGLPPPVRPWSEPADCVPEPLFDAHMVHFVCLRHCGVPLAGAEGFPECVTTHHAARAASVMRAARQRVAPGRPADAYNDAMSAQVFSRGEPVSFARALDNVRGAGEAVNRHHLRGTMHRVDAEWDGQLETIAAVLLVERADVAPRAFDPRRDFVGRVNFAAFALHRAVLRKAGVPVADFPAALDDGEALVMATTLVTAARAHLT
jgi:hypothetical protein